jgi:hypothetical protein
MLKIRGLGIGFAVFLTLDFFGSSVLLGNMAAVGQFWIVLNCLSGDSHENFRHRSCGHGVCRARLAQYLRNLSVNRAALI